MLIYLCSLLLAESYTPEPIPGSRPCKYPCGYFAKAVEWITPSICCDTCYIWHYQDCLGLKDCAHFVLRNVSWECMKCSMPDYSSTLFDTTLFEISNSFDPLIHNTSDRALSFACPRLTSSPKAASVNQSRIQHASTSTIHTSDTSSVVSVFPSSKPQLL